MIIVLQNPTTVVTDDALDDDAGHDEGRIFASRCHVHDDDTVLWAAPYRQLVDDAFEDDVLIDGRLWPGER